MTDFTERELAYVYKDELERLRAVEASDEYRLGVAWKAAEAALPEGWFMRVDGDIGTGYEARAKELGGVQMAEGRGPTAAEALDALAALLRGEEVTEHEWCCDEHERMALAMTLGLRIMDENDPLLSMALNAGRFEPDFNVCALCKHLGGDHDLNNRCLICGDFFASMTVAEQWTYGQDLFRAALLRTAK